MDNPPEAVKAMARRIAADHFERVLHEPSLARWVRQGKWDDQGCITVLSAAIIETSELCAKLADREAEDAYDDDEPGDLWVANRIARLVRRGDHLPETPHED